MTPDDLTLQADVVGDRIVISFPAPVLGFRLSKQRAQGLVWMLNELIARLPDGDAGENPPLRPPPPPETPDSEPQPSPEPGA